MPVVSLLQIEQIECGAGIVLLADKVKGLVC